MTFVKDALSNIGFAGLMLAGCAALALIAYLLVKLSRAGKKDDGGYGPPFWVYALQKLGSVVLLSAGALLLYLLLYVGGLAIAAMNAFPPGDGKP